MKNKKIMIIIITCALLLGIVLLLFITKHNNKETPIKELDFNEKFIIEEENYTNDGVNFIYSGKFVNKTNEEQTLDCVHIDFKDVNNNNLLTREESIREILDSKKEYIISFNYESNITPDQINSIEYKSCY